ncbi:nwd2 [Moniliophthora roreri]|nr:nwd2 [Moniliophthora roreri]
MWVSQFEYFIGSSRARRQVLTDRHSSPGKTKRPSLIPTIQGYKPAKDTNGRSVWDVATRNSFIKNYANVFTWRSSAARSLSTTDVRLADV